MSLDILCQAAAYVSSTADRAAPSTPAPLGDLTHRPPAILTESSFKDKTCGKYNGFTAINAPAGRSEVKAKSALNALALVEKSGNIPTAIKVPAGGGDTGAGVIGTKALVVSENGGHGDEAGSPGGGKVKLTETRRPRKRTPLPLEKPTLGSSVLSTKQEDDFDMLDADKENLKPGTIRLKRPAQPAQPRPRTCPNRIEKKRRPLAEYSLHPASDARTHWSEEQTDLLISLKEIKKMEFRDMVTYFKDPIRTVKALAVKYSKLNRRPARRLCWTRQELDKLVRLKRENMDLTASDLAKELTAPHRSPGSVHGKWLALLDQDPELRAEVARHQTETVNSHLAYVTGTEAGAGAASE